MAHRTIVGIDVGTTKVCTIVGQVYDNGRINVLGVGLTPSKGLDKGVVVNIDDAVNAIATSIEKAERLSGYRISAAFVGIAGRHIQSLNSRGVVAVARSDHEITRHDVARAVEAAQAVAIPTQREVIHVIPRAYVVDGNEGIRDPIGMSGFRLEVETHIITGEIMAIQNLIKSVQKTGVEIDDLVLQPLAAGEAVLSADDKDRGVVLVDIGGGTTDIAVFAQGGIWHTSVIPVGGNHFTNDIVIVQQTPHNTAEYLKLKYGAAIAEETEEPDVIEAEGFAPGERQQISRHMLNQVLQARAEELTELIYNEIRRSGYEGLLPAGIVLTGGTAQLPRLDELMRDMLGIPVRIGAPTDLTGLADTLNSPAYATAIGLLRWGMRHGMSGFHSGGGPPPDHGGWVSTYERFKRWLKEFLP
ncbi:cell division protein FtsA [Roseiflexus castenholzii]|jgi:cell division protein FtsA|uniref:Cell division protein FtsA n=1 Tax=Roseiflexus castenholzii (strain DSM 13941 / HLO8) TaxID=383372 RepID=A7NI87_ROSCS|nr:cell division protein FtsA [Roseiflexus castenholzii]ABU57187.1 cell division protein FtsA [Roseiflexus castenholzii DSM 13941]